ncbi:GIY-YIG catalytic domain-containing protein [Streptomyces qinglanensis]|uniref:GIY-YIG catalytic domain-containing protein n=1 Tax=Streptomyces qinglanensis TaxID=943816 RepID=A0A1H9U1B8_9ACTN|nr:GIY-YIG catalytic domain-containing protein [Streptomyces qinglanensis]
MYRLYDAEGTLLYVGVTWAPKQRWKDHRKEMLWWPEVTDKHLTWYGTRPEAEEAELSAIQAENPLYNKSGFGFDAEGEPLGPVLPSGVPPQPWGARIAYQLPAVRPAYRLEWFTWRAQLRDAYLTPEERAALGRRQGRYD